MCIIKVYLPETSLERTAQLQDCIGQAVTGIERVGIRQVDQIIWHFVETSETSSRPASITVEISTFIGPEYQAKYTRQSLASAVGEIVRGCFPHKARTITCLVDYPRDEYGSWTSPPM